MVKLLILMAIFPMLSCKGDSDGRETAFTDASGTSTVSFNEASDKVASIEDDSLDNLTIYTSGSGTPNCTTYTLTLKDKDSKPVAGAVAEFSAQYQSAKPGSPGIFNSVTPTSDDDGKVSGIFCADTDPFKAVIIARVVNLTKNSAEITASKKGTYTFRYLGSSQDANGEEAKDVKLNFWEAGPEDCAYLYFQLTLDEDPVVAESIDFKTPYDMPLGVKLAERNATRTLDTDASSGRKRAKFTAISSGEGIFTVPACAGNALGNFNVSAEIVNDEGKKTITESATIFISGGLPIQANFTSTYDVSNAKTLQGFFNTNSSYKLNTKIQTNSLNDGDAIITSPISVSAETGKVTINNSGQLQDGMADFSIQALHMTNYYAYPVEPFIGYPEALTRCHPPAIGSYLTSTAQPSISYFDLSKNWRSTLVYQTQGQEYYFDRNGNGRYDAGGDGFWDKNQNGVWDPGIDELTFDANNNGFNSLEGEYFIDLPSPFIDVDENNTYQADVDILLTESYSPPNGARDKSGLIWKYDVYPIYMGMSFYGLAREEIMQNHTQLPVSNVSSDSGGADFGQNFFTSLANVPDGAISTQKAHIFAHGICGNVLPGGTKLELSAIKTSGGEVGERTPTFYFVQDPAEQYLDASRTLLITEPGSGGSSAKINFNASSHPNAALGYPVTFNSRTPACVNNCTGAVQSSPGYFCDAASFEVKLKISEPDSFGDQKFSLDTYNFINYPTTNSCSCLANASHVGGGQCACNGILKLNDTGTACQ